MSTGGCGVCVECSECLDTSLYSIIARSGSTGLNISHYVADRRETDSEGMRRKTDSEGMQLTLLFFYAYFVQTFEKI